MPSKIKSDIIFKTPNDLFCEGDIKTDYIFACSTLHRSVKIPETGDNTTKKVNFFAFLLNTIHNQAQIMTFYSILIRQLTSQGHQTGKPFVLRGRIHPCRGSLKNKQQIWPLNTLIFKLQNCLDKKEG
jgi:hypothetical protein